MAVRRGAARGADALADTKRVVRRAGAAWNKHDEAFLDSAIRLAIEHGLSDVKLEYGSVRLRIDTPRGTAKLAEMQHAAAAVQGAEKDDVEMDGLQPRAAGKPDGVAPAQHADFVTQRAAASPAPAADEAEDMEECDELARLRRKEQTRREARKRQRTNRKARERQQHADDEEAKVSKAPAPASAFTFGTPPGLNPAASPFVFGTSAGGSPPTPGDRGGAAKNGGRPAGPAASGGMVHVPALMAGPGTLSMVQAQTMLLEKISATNIREARSHPSGSSRPSPEIKHRGVIFPGQDDNLGERDVALIEGSFGARKSAAELGKLLHQHLNPQLTDEGLRHLVEYLRTGSRPF